MPDLAQAVVSNTTPLIALTAATGNLDASMKASAEELRACPI